MTKAYNFLLDIWKSFNLKLICVLSPGQKYHKSTKNFTQNSKSSESVQFLKKSFFYRTHSSL